MKFKLNDFLRYNVKVILFCRFFSHYRCIDRSSSFVLLCTFYWPTTIIYCLVTIRSMYR